MFTLKESNVIESNEGFCLEVSGRSGLKYRENDKMMLIDSEVTTNGMAVYVPSIKKWEPPNSEKIITDNKREIILKNIRDALTFWGTGEYVVDFVNY